MKEPQLETEKGIERKGEPKVMERKAEKVGKGLPASRGGLAFLSIMGEELGRDAYLPPSWPCYFMTQAEVLQAAVAVAVTAQEVCPVCAHNEEHPDPFSHPTPWLWDFFTLPDLSGRWVRTRKWNGTQMCSTS